eukprot:gb/GEZN01029673.1/.p2 GENE.gb/GEZN01029673.1/~~gb/GEZN01029673.1/.p2  ORF type:complete len:149 (-),score=38.15 gb/GEZN01029673.1/:4-450(-)
MNSSAPFVSSVNASKRFFSAAAVSSSLLIFWMPGFLLVFILADLSLFWTAAAVTLRGGEALLKLEDAVGLVEGEEVFVNPRLEAWPADIRRCPSPPPLWVLCWDGCEGLKILGARASATACLALDFAACDIVGRADVLEELEELEELE